MRPTSSDDRIWEEGPGGYAVGALLPGGRARTARDAGSSVVETVLVLPALMLAVLAVFQFALYGLAAHAVDDAVASAGAVARSSTGGIANADRVLARDAAHLGGGMLIRPHYSVTERVGPEMVVSAVAGVPSVLPGVHLTVRAASIGPLQVFRAG